MKLELGLDADDLCELGIVPQQWLHDGQKVMAQCASSKRRHATTAAEKVLKLERMALRELKFQGTLK